MLADFCHFTIKVLLHANLLQLHCAFVTALLELCEVHSILIFCP
jgi:hypothetical protein